MNPFGGILTRSSTRSGRDHYLGGKDGGRRASRRGGGVVIAQPFVAVHRGQVVNDLLRDLDDVTATCTPRVVYLEAPLGWGKTRIVQEFYARLAATQPRPAYWPVSLTSEETPDARALHFQRKRLRPRPFVVDSDVRPPWIWLAIEVDQSLLPRPDEIHRSLVEQLEPHLFATLRMQKLGTAALRLAGGLLFTLVGLPPTVEQIADLLDVSRTAAADLRGTWSRQITVNGAPPVSEGSARLWKLLSTVWGSDGRGGPPIILVIEDAHSLSQQSVELLRTVLAARLPCLVVACGWPLGDSERHAPMRELMSDAPEGLRVRSLERVGVDDARELVLLLHPGTQQNVAQALAERCGGNLYALRLLLVNQQAVPGEPFDADPEWLRQVDTDLHAQLAQMLDQTSAAARTALAAMAVAGYRMPEQVAAAVMVAVPPASLDAATATDWVHRETPFAELVTFLEPIRQEVALGYADRRLPSPIRAGILRRGLDTVRMMLDDDVPDVDRDLLHVLHLSLAERVVDRDEDALARSVVALLLSFWEQRAMIAMQVLEARSDTLVRRDRLGPEAAAELALVRAQSVRHITERYDSRFVSSLDQAEALVTRVADDRPDLLAQLRLEQSRLHRAHWLRELRDLDRARREVDEALEIVENLGDSAGERLLHSARGCEYSQVAAEGDRRRAKGMAIAESARVSALAGGPTTASIGSLAEAAHIAARVDLNEGIALSRQVLDAKADQLGSLRHPNVAISRKDLAVRLLRTNDEAYIDEALALIDDALGVLMPAYGPDHRSVLNAKQARSYALQRLAARYWGIGDVSSSLECAREALAVAVDVRARREQIAPEAEFLLSDERIALATAWSGDPAGIARLYEVLRARREDRQQPPELAEVRWLVRDLAAALRRHDRAGEAAQLEQAYSVQA